MVRTPGRNRPLAKAGASGLRVLVVDGSAAGRDVLAGWLLSNPAVTEVLTALDAAAALRFDPMTVDAAFVHVDLPGLDGIGLARIFGQFASPPPVVFVAGESRRAVEAFELGAIDFVLRTAGADRLAESVRRVQEFDRGAANRPRTPATAALQPAGDVVRRRTNPSATPSSALPDRRLDRRTTRQESPRQTTRSYLVAVDVMGTREDLPLSAVRWAEARGDYIQLHTASGSHLVRGPLATLVAGSAVDGLVQIHRSYAVQLTAISELRRSDKRYTVAVDGRELPVSRRYARQVKDRLVRQVRPAEAA